jgi:hypothetical protein
MSVKVAGAWETGWVSPKEEYELWQHPLREYGVGEICMSPVSGIMAGTSQTLLVEKQQTETFIVDARAAGMIIVFIDEAAETELPDFVHPENVLYVLGKTSMSPYVLFYKPELGDLAVKIPTAQNTGGLWAHQAATMVLHDRFLKA